MPRVLTWTWCFALLSSSAAAQATLPFWDDFERGGLVAGDVPPGAWQAKLTSAPSTVVAADAGAHDRGYGLRATDGSSTDTSSMPACINKTFVRSPGDRYFRQWVRLTPSVTSGVIDIGLLWDGVSTSSLCNLQVVYPSASLNVGLTIGAGFVSWDAGVFLAGGTWHLLECALRNTGSAAAEIILWVDGVERVRQSGLDATGILMSEVDVGENYTNTGTFQGTIDVDDVAVTTTPPASRLRIDAGTGQLAAGACVPVQIQLTSSEGPPAASLRPEPLVMTSAGPAATIYSDATCTSTGAPVVAAGQTATVVGVISGAGTLTLNAQAGDLLGDTATFNAGGGAGALPLELVVECGCSSAPPAFALFALAIVSRAFRQQRDPPARGERAR